MVFAELKRVGSEATPERKDESKFYEIARRKSQPDPKLNVKLIETARHQPKAEPVVPTPAWIPGTLKEPVGRFLNRGAVKNFMTLHPRERERMTNIVLIAAATASVTAIALLLALKG